MFYGSYFYRVTTEQGVQKDYKMRAWAEKFARTLVRADIILVHRNKSGEHNMRKIWIKGESQLCWYEVKSYC